VLEDYAMVPKGLRPGTQDLWSNFVEFETLGRKGGGERLIGAELVAQVT